MLYKRIKLHPATDRFMMGDIYGTVKDWGKTKSGQEYYLVHMDRSNKTIKVRPEDLQFID